MPFDAAVPRTMCATRGFIGGSREPSLEDFSVVRLAWGQVVSRTTLPSELIFTLGAGASRQSAPLTHSPLWISNL